MSARHRAAFAGFAWVFVALALPHAVYARPRAAKPPAAQSPAAVSPGAQTTAPDSWLERLWYQATIAYLLDLTDYASGEAQIARGRELFPSDAFLLVEQGRFHEACASPHMQAVARDNPSARVRPASAHRQTAERLYDDSLKQWADVLLRRLYQLFPAGGS